jgi:hypothetical protein
MSRLRRLLQPINWAYAVGEIALIVAGVLIALAIDSWNQSRQDRRDELLVLRQLCSELRTDSTDAQFNIRDVEKARTSALLIKAHLDRGLAYSNSLDVHFGRLGMLPQHLRNAGAYQTLKSRGLDLISNDTLRTEITHLYEAQYGFVDKIDGSLRDQVNRWLPIMARRFEQENALGPAQPRRYAALAQDEEFRQMLNERIAITPAFVIIESRMLAKIVALIAAVEQETGGCKSQS